MSRKKKLLPIRVEGEFCIDPRHDEPCPQPCAACREECDPKMVKRAVPLVARPRKCEFE